MKDGTRTFGERVRQTSRLNLLMAVFIVYIVAFILAELLRIILGAVGI